MDDGNTRILQSDTRKNAHKAMNSSVRDIQKIIIEVNGIMVKATSQEVDMAPPDIRRKSLMQLNGP